jgi:hypothetical protein
MRAIFGSQYQMRLCPVADHRNRLAIDFKDAPIAIKQWFIRH